MRKGLASPLPAGCLQKGQKHVCRPQRQHGAAASRHPGQERGRLTGTVQIVGVIRMALMRATSWTNYLCFTA